MANFDTAPHITDERIRELVEDLSTVTGSNKHGGTTAFDNVLRGILELSNAYMPFYNSNEPLTKAELKKVYDAFDNFYSTCSEYLRGKGDTRASGYGQGRLTCVRNLMNQVGKDLDALVRVYQNTPENGTTPPLAEILHKGRGLSVVVDDPSEIMPVGGAINQRIPIRVQTDIQDQKGFFTPENTMKSRAEAERELEERYAGDPVANKLFRFVSSGDEEEREEQQERFVQLLGGGFGNAMLEIEGAPNLDEDELFEYLWNDKAAMHTVQLSLANFWQEYAENTAEGINDTITEDEVFGDKETFRSFYNLARDAMRANAGYKGLKAAGIKEGEEVAKRNVLQSRMAMLIGNGNLVANAKTMELQVGDTRQKGIFMETAEGSNVNRVKFAQLNEGDPVSKEIADPMMGATTEDYRNSPQLIMDLADLQVHDYLVGSTDRSISNMIIDMDWSTGKYSRNSGAVKVNGLKGIDNDNCAGDASDEELQKAGPYGCMMPQEMLVIRRSTAEKIMRISNDALRLYVQDLNLSERELKAMEYRLNKLKYHIYEGYKYFNNKENLDDLTMYNKNQMVKSGYIRILDDKDFEKEGLYEQLTRGENTRVRDKEGVFKNYFQRVEQIPATVAYDYNQWQKREKASQKNKNAFRISEDREIHYAMARPGEREIIQKGPIDMSAVIQDLAYMNSMLARMKRADGLLHRNSGSYTWMKESAEALQQELVRISKQNRMTVSSNDAYTLDRLYRQVNLASQNYLDTHTGKRKSMGTARKEIAEDFTLIRCPRKGMSAVVERKIDDLQEELQPNGHTPSKRAVKTGSISKTLKQKKQENNIL